MSLIDTIKEMGSIAIITMVFGVFLSLLIKNLPNHFGNQNYDMYFNLLIILAGLQLFVIIYIGTRPYINLYKDPSGKIPVQDDKDFFYYWWDWMYPGYGTKGIELDVFMYITYLIVIILVILVVLNKVNNKGDFDSQDFKNPLSFGICLLEDNGYNIFLLGNIFMFLYISRFMIKGLNLIGSKTVACPGNNMKSCFSQEEIELFSTIKECNDNMTEVECEKEEYPIFKLDGCSTVENEFLKSVYDYKSPLKVIKDPDTNKFRLKNDNNKSYKELGSKCKKSINDLLLKMDASNFPPEKCGDSEFNVESGCSAITGSSFKSHNENYYCQSNPCLSDECCTTDG